MLAGNETTSLRSRQRRRFDAADAVSKRLNEDGQEDEHTKPETAL